MYTVYFFREVGLYQFTIDGKTIKVAIKKVFQNPNYKNREFSIQSKLNHRNIVRILVPQGIYTESRSNPNGNYLHIVMEHFDRSIFHVIHRSRKEPRELNRVKIQQYLQMVLNGLHYLDELNVAHRDLKPENLLVRYARNDDEEDRVAVCDFGNAKVLTGDEESICYICTRMYRSPELVYGAVKYTNAVDMWSMACIVIEMCLTVPMFGLTIRSQEIEHTVSDGVQLTEAVKKPYSLWLDIASALGMPTDSDWEDMGVTDQVKDHYNGLAANSLLNSARPIADDNTGLEMSLWRLYGETLKSGKCKVDKSTGEPVSFEECFPPSLIDLLEKTLVYSPKKRLKPLDALRHPYFDQIF
eukprot:GHVH01006581.1.p1 GENE.GHVH01006581.1~~GHVH01006581.1.p1  ORF type:complete len:356 (+),score=48.42 GHVH01006581.1:1106-2173(+)